MSFQAALRFNAKCNFIKISLYEFGICGLKRFNSNDRIDLTIIKKHLYELKKDIIIITNPPNKEYKLEKYDKKINECIYDLTFSKADKTEYYSLIIKVDTLEARIKHFIDVNYTF